MSEAGDAGGARLSATPAGVKLCPASDLADSGARGFILQIRSGRSHGFVIRQGEALRGYVDRWPHAGLPLARWLRRWILRSGQSLQT